MTPRQKLQAIEKYALDHVEGRDGDKDAGLIIDHWFTLPDSFLKFWVATQITAVAAGWCEHNEGDYDDGVVS